jgi:hypothetical protein
MGANGTYRLFVTDVAAGEVTFIGSIKEDGTPAVLALRLKIENRQISEVETFVQRSERSAQGFENNQPVTAGKSRPDPTTGGDTRTLQTPDGRAVTTGPAQLRTWQVAELFKSKQSWKGLPTV